MPNNRMWLLLILALAACLAISVALGAFQGRVKPSFSTNSQNRTRSPSLSASPSVTPSGAPSSWESLIPVIRPILKAHLNRINEDELQIEHDFPISIWQEATIIGNGTSVAVVGLGSGGLQASAVTVMTHADGAQPTIALFKQGTGQPAPLIEWQGGTPYGGVSVGILPKLDAVVVGHWSRMVTEQSPKDTFHCSVDAYRWDSASKMFISDAALSDKVRVRYCPVVDSSMWQGWEALEL